MAATILLIEDDNTFSSLLGEQLEDQGFQVLFAGDGIEGLQMLQRHQPDLILLDIMMPRMNGWETCRRIRDLSDVPIIMLTCRTDELEKVRGLELGADDYVTKPFSTVELMARIQAALRRGGQRRAMKQPTQIDDRLAVDRARCEVFVDGQRVDLSAIEYKLLACFLDHANMVLTHQNLLTQVWGWEYAEEKDYLKVYVHHLRNKIEQDPQHPSYIHTERGLGYRFQTRWHL